MVLQYYIIILYYNIIILCDHRPICGPSLTETSLCGAYLYNTVTTECFLGITKAHNTVSNYRNCGFNVILGQNFGGLGVVIKERWLFIILWGCGPTQTMAFSFLRSLDHKQRTATVVKIPSTNDQLVAETSTWQQTSMHPAWCGPGSSVGIATDYGLDGPGIESRWGRDFPPFQTGPGAHPASCSMVTGSFPGVKCGRGVLTTHPLLAPRSWKSRAIPQPPLWGTTGPLTGLLYLYLYLRCDSNPQSQSSGLRLQLFITIT
jgi:hypothetical protein